MVDRSDVSSISLVILDRSSLFLVYVSFIFLARDNQDLLYTSVHSGDISIDCNFSCNLTQSWNEDRTRDCVANTRDDNCVFWSYEMLLLYIFSSTDVIIYPCLHTLIALAPRRALPVSGCVVIG